MIAWLKSGLGLAVSLIVAALLLFGAIRLYVYLGERQAAKDAGWKAKLELAQDSVEIFRAQAAQDSVVYVNTVKPIYLKARETALKDPMTTQPVKDLIKACDDGLNACEAVQASLRGQIRTLEVANDLLSHPPKPGRLQAYGTAEYDLLNQRPVFNVGATFRLVGPLSAVGRAEYAIPSAVRLSRGGETRLLVGGRVSF